jgi:hypothetical protein
MLDATKVFEIILHCKKAFSSVGSNSVLEHEIDSFHRVPGVGMGKQLCDRGELLNK